MQLKAIGCAVLGFFLFANITFAGDGMLTYKNNRGSVLKLQFSADNVLIGTYTTAVASKECPQVIGLERPIIGYITNNALAISIGYPACGSVVTFIGNIENDRSAIDTTSLVVHQSRDLTKSKKQATRFVGHDVFSRV